MDIETSGDWADYYGYERYMMPANVGCPCEWCKGKEATHAGFANGLVLTPPLCEDCASRWVNNARVWN